MSCAAGSGLIGTLSLLSDAGTLNVAIVGLFKVRTCKGLPGAKLGPRLLGLVNENAPGSQTISTP